MSLAIQKNHWVKLQYRVTDTMGAEIEEGQRSLTYLHGGYGMLFPKLETLLEGKKEGEQVIAQLEPEDHFGDYEVELVHLVDRSLLPEALEEGMTFEGLPGKANDGEVYTVTDIADGQVVMDGNHPLAGLALRFDITVQEVREATEDEIAREMALVDEGEEFDASQIVSSSPSIH